jgi:hypothetical protein
MRADSPFRFRRRVVRRIGHSWQQDEIFVIFTAYFDESDTHGAAPNAVMVAFLGRALQWQRFEKRLAKLQKRYGFRVFHAKEKRKTGDFTGWSDEKCMALISDLVALVRGKT